MSEKVLIEKIKKEWELHKNNHSKDWEWFESDILPRMKFVGF